MSSLVSWEEVLAGESEEVQRAIAEAIVARRKADALRQLRAVARRTQDKIDKVRTSKASPRNDRLLASLNAYVRGRGGILKIVAELPGVERIELEITQRATVKGATAALLRETDIRSTRRPRPAAPKRKSA